MPDDAPPEHPARLPDVLSIDPATVPSVALQRLIAEVQQELREEDETLTPHAYDRIHNRHNRGPLHLPRPYNRVHNRHNRGR